MVGILILLIYFSHLKFLVSQPIWNIANLLKDLRRQPSGVDIKYRNTKDEQHRNCFLQDLSKIYHRFSFLMVC